jgi:hypothetical protein
MLNIIPFGLFFMFLLHTDTGTLVPLRVDAAVAYMITEDSCRTIYDDCALEGKLKYEIFHRALAGQLVFNAPRRDIITILDFTKHSGERRFFVIDLVHHKVIIQTLVAHGTNSGERSCTIFSNKPKSLKSSPGFFLTAETYAGRHGYSMRLDGLEPGVNDLARPRAIVVHGADYVSNAFVKEYGYIGHSFGCPAVPEHLNQQIIDLIKGGTCFYIHTNDASYLSHSAMKPLVQ